MGKVIVLDGPRAPFARVTLCAVRDVQEPAHRQPDGGEDEGENDAGERHLLRRVRHRSSTPRAMRTVAAANQTVNGTVKSTAGSYPWRRAGSLP